METNNIKNIAVSDIFKKFFLEFSIIFSIFFLYLAYIPGWTKEWLNPDSFYAFGVFLFIFIIYYLKENFTSLLNTEKKSSKTGYIFLFAASLLYIVGVKAEYIYLISFSLPLFISGTILLLYGKKVFIKLLFPLVLFTFTLPIFSMYRITNPLQTLSSNCSTGLLKSLGIAAFNQGNTIYINQHRLAIVAGCSGVKSLFSLFFISIIYSYFINGDLWKKIMFVILSVPLALVMNILRITFVGFYVLYNGTGGVEEVHDMAGIAGYIISIGLMTLLAQKIKNKKEINESNEEL